MHEWYLCTKNKWTDGKCVHVYGVGQNISVGIVTPYGLEGSSPGGARFSAPIQTSPHSLLYNGYQVFSGLGIDHSPTPSSEIKERAELYF